MMTNQPLSLFISSKMTELAEERRAVKSALSQYQMQGWLFEQDAGARPEPIKSTYLKEVEACDIYIGIFWLGYGPYTIEEYEKARALHKPCLIYEKDRDTDRRDPQLTTFLESIQHVTDPKGLTVCRFHTPEALATQVKKSVMHLLVTLFRESRQQSVWNIPFSNPNFTGRDDLLDKLHQYFMRTGQNDSAPTHRAALTQPLAISGLGGIGKTQMAIEYAYRHHQYYNKAALWGSADTRDTLTTSFVNIARLLNLPGKDDKNQKIAVEAIKDWLASESGWLLILDNIDDLALLNEFLPPVFRGHLLLTTRSSATGEVADPLKINEMQPETGALLLLRRARLLRQAGRIVQGGSLENASPSDVEIAKELSKEMGGLPLALDQAGAYIEETACSLQQYYDLYQTQRAKLLNRRGGLRKDYPESVATTWNISFQKVKKSNRAAIDLLHLCAFLKPDTIPEELITQGAPHLGKVLQRIAADDNKWNEAIAALLKYSLIKRPAEKTLSIHRLVQEVVRNSLPSQESKLWAKRILYAIDGLFSGPRIDSSNPNAEFAYWPMYERLILHVSICADWAEQASIEPQRVAQLLTKAGSYLQNRGRFAEVELYYERAYELHTNLRGFAAQIRIALSTASSLINLTTLYIAQGKYEKAEESLQQINHTYEQQGLDSGPFIAQLWNAFGGLYLHQGRYTEAERVLHFAKNEYEKELKKLESYGNPSTMAILAKVAAPSTEIKLKMEYAVALNNLATVYREQRRYEDAKQLYRRSLNIRQDILPQDLFVANVQRNLATLYRYQGKYEQAEELYRHVLNLQRTLLEESHPDTATSQNDLATLYCLQGRYVEAEPLYRCALAIRERRPSANPPDTAESLNGLATLYCLQGRYAEAEPLYRRALSICKQCLSQDHPLTQKVYKNYVLLLRTMGRDEEAK